MLPSTSELQLPRHRWSLEDWHRMIETGVLGEDDRVELIHGEVVEMSPASDGHSAVLLFLSAVYSRAASPTAPLLLMQAPLQVPPDSEPEPDLMLVRREVLHRRAKPRSEDVLLLVEVALSSRATDLSIKVPLYAAAGIPEVWVVDLAARVVHVFRHPVDGSYQHHAELSGGHLSPTAFPDFVVDVEELIG